MPDDVGRLFEGVTLDSFSLDSTGRIVVQDSALAKKIREMGPPKGGLSEMAGNGLCCGNTGCLSDELVDMLNKVVTSRGRQG